MIKEEVYKETFGILIAILAIIAFIVSTAEFVVLKEEPYIDEVTVTSKDVKNIFYSLYIKSAVSFIFIFFLYILNKNYIITKTWIIKFTKWSIVSVMFVLFTLYLQVLYKWIWLGKILYYSTRDLETFFGLISVLIRPGSIAQFLMLLLIGGYIMISILNFIGFVKKKRKRK